MSRARSLLLALAFASAVLVPVFARPALACFSGHGQVYLSDFAGGAGTGLSDVPTIFYAGSEGSSATATVRPTLSCTDAPEPEIGRVRADYETEHLPPATAGASDYQDVDGTTPVICASVHESDSTTCGGDPDSHGVPIPLVQDMVEEAAVEWLRFRLTDGEAVTTGGGNGVGGVGSPSEARVYVVDADGVTRPALEPGAESQSYPKVEGAHIRIPVFRAGPTTTGVTFSVAGHGSDPAEPGDFTCMPSCGGTLNNFPEAGGRLGFVTIDVVNDSTAELDEFLRVSVAGAAPTDDAFTTVKILDNESDDAPPFSRFHHPKDGWKYLRGDYRIREPHTITGDPGVAELDQVMFALRQKKTNGSCRWWRGELFTTGPCADRHWLNMTFLEVWDPTQDLYRYNLPKLAPSVGTTVKNYTAWTRATDTAGNVESIFEKGRNYSVFEVLSPQ
jgi:hypothetical protein